MSHLHRLFTLTSYRQTQQQQQQQQQQQHTKISAQSAIMAPRLFFLLFLLSEAASEPEVIEVQVGPEQLGQDVTLPCQTGDVTIRAVKWIRSDLKPPKDVLFWRDGHSDTPFKGRVYLVDDQLRTRNVSLILKNVSREDVGTYECRVATAGSRRKKRAVIDSDPISIIRLLVTESQKGDANDKHTNDKHTNDNNNNNGDTNDGTFTPQHVGLAAVAVVVLVSVAVGLFLVRKFKRQRENEPEPSAAEETGGDNLL